MVMGETAEGDSVLPCVDSGVGVVGAGASEKRDYSEKNNN